MSLSIELVEDVEELDWLELSDEDLDEMFVEWLMKQEGEQNE